MSKTGIILDIDNTLARTSESFFFCMAERFGVPPGMTAEGLYRQYGYSWRVPMWQHDEAARWANLQEASTEFHAAISVIDEARLGVAKIEAMTGVAAYVSTRPEATRTVTENWLAQYSFPRATLVMRPDHVPLKEGNRWKASVVCNRYSSSFGIVDDHHDVALSLKDLYRGYVFISNVRAPEFVALRVVHCKHWRDVVREVEERYACIHAD